MKTQAAATRPYEQGTRMFFENFNVATAMFFKLRAIDVHCSLGRVPCSLLRTEN